MKSTEIELKILNRLVPLFRVEVAVVAQHLDARAGQRVLHRPGHRRYRVRLSTRMNNDSDTVKRNSVTST